MICDEGMYGDDVNIDELQESFESFFKASMGFGDGPVLMPDGSTIDAASVRVLGNVRGAAGCWGPANVVG